MAEAAVKEQKALSANRRYVGTRETVAYVAYDVAQSFNINKYQDIFITDIVKISLSFQTLVTFVIGIWDVINDIFLAAIVDKTRTRFGKFRPWLLVCSAKSATSRVQATATSLQERNICSLLCVRFFPRLQAYSVLFRSSSTTFRVKRESVCTVSFWNAARVL